MPGLGALAQFDFDHPDLVLTGSFLKFLRAEGAVRVAAAEITAADFPDQVAAMQPVIPADAAFSGVMREMAAFRAEVQCLDRPRAERAETHRRNIEDRRRIRLLALRAADLDPEEFMRHRHGADGMVDPFKLVAIDVQFRAEWLHVHCVLGPLIDDGTLVPAERLSVQVAFHQILVDLGADFLDGPAQLPDERIDALDRMPGLQQVVYAGGSKRQQHDERPTAPMREKCGKRADKAGGYGKSEWQVAN